MLTYKVADGGQLPVFLHAHIASVTGFKCHPPAMPFYFKHGVGRAVGEGKISERERGAEFGLLILLGFQGGTQKYPLPVEVPIAW